MNTIVCPYCGKDVALIRYGGAWIGVCCHRIIYNEEELPGDKSINRDMAAVELEHDSPS